MQKNTENVTKYKIWEYVPNRRGINMLFITNFYSLFVDTST